MANKYYSDNVQRARPLSAPKPEPKGKTVSAPSFPQYPDKEQKGLGKV